MDMPSPPAPHTSHILLAVFALLVVLVSLGGRLYYRHERLRAHRKTYEELSAIADLKASQIAAWKQDRLADANLVLATRPLMDGMARIAMGATADTAAVEAWLSAWCTHYGYDDALLLDIEADTLCAAGAIHTYRDDHLGRLVTACIDQRTVLFSRIHHGLHPEDVHIGLIMPVFDGGNPDSAAVVGALLFRIDLREFLLPLVQSWPTPSPTAESLLVRREGDNVLYLSNLRHRPGTALQLSVPIDAGDIAAVAAMRGTQGRVRGPDYRGVTVFAHVRPIPDTPWFLICKVDTDEAEAALRKTALPLAVGAVALIVAAGAGLAFFWRRQLGRWLEHEIRLQQQRTEAERTLRLTQERFRSTFEQAAVGIAHVSTDGRWLRVNQRLCDMLGYTREELLQLRFQDVTHADDLDTDMENVQQMLDGDIDTYAMEKRYIRKDGSILWIKLTVSLLRDAEGTPQHFISVIEDTSARKAVEHALQDSRRMLRLVLDTIPQRVFWKDHDLRFLGCNQPFAEDAGCEVPDEVIGRSDYDMMWHKDADRYREDDRGVMSSGASKLAYEEPRQAPDGTVRWMRTSKVPLRDADGNVTGVLGTYEDVTERKCQEEKQERLARELERKNRELAQVVYVASHDLRSPLVNIQGFSRELKTAIADLDGVLADAGLPPSVDCAVRAITETDIPESLNFILSSAAQMDRLLAGLLRISRLGRTTLTVVTVDTNRLVADIIESLSFQLREAGADVHVDNLPPCRADEAQLQQVFANLIGNAVKYADPERPLTIRVSGRESAQDVVYCVADTGRGIAPKYHDKVFELFNRLAPNDTDGEGLGLTTVRTIMDRHHGRVWLESEPGVGSTFCFAVPR